MSPLRMLPSAAEYDAFRERLRALGERHRWLMAGIATTIDQTNETLIGWAWLNAHMARYNDRWAEKLARFRWWKPWTWDTTPEDDGSL